MNTWEGRSLHGPQSELLLRWAHFCNPEAANCLLLAWSFEMPDRLRGAKSPTLMKVALPVPGGLSSRSLPCGTRVLEFRLRERECPWMGTWEGQVIIPVAHTLA